MQVVAFGSGSCSTIDKMFEFQRELAERSDRRGYEIVALVTDNEDSGAHEISERENVPLVHVDFLKFVKNCGFDPKNKVHRKDERLRLSYDYAVLDELVKCADFHEFRIDLVALAGYMLRMYKPLLRSFDGRIINSHPGRLATLEDGKRKYTGDKAVLKALNAGESETYTSIHVVREEIDGGEILVTSEPVPVDVERVAQIKTYFKIGTQDLYREVLVEIYDERKVPENERDFSSRAFFRESMRQLADKHQGRQKYACDYPAYMFALENIAEGLFELESVEDRVLRKVIFRGEDMPYEGVQLPVRF